MTSQLNLLRIPISDKFNRIHLVMHTKKILFKEFKFWERHTCLDK